MDHDLSQLLHQPTYEAGLSQSLAYRALSKFMAKFLRRFSLSLPEWKLLGHLGEARKMSPGQIAELIGVRAPIATRLLKDLEAKSLLTRERNSSDSRRVGVTITTKGVQAIRDIEKELRPALARFLYDIDAEELAAYLRVTRQLANKLRREQRK